MIIIVIFVIMIDTNFEYIKYMLSENIENFFTIASTHLLICAFLSEILAYNIFKAKHLENLQWSIEV